MKLTITRLALAALALPLVACSTVGYGDPNPYGQEKTSDDSQQNSNGLKPRFGIHNVIACVLMFRQQGWQQRQAAWQHRTGRELPDHL